MGTTFFGPGGPAIFSGHINRVCTPRQRRTSSFTPCPSHSGASATGGIRSMMRVVCLASSRRRMTPSS